MIRENFELGLDFEANLTRKISLNLRALLNSNVRRFLLFPVDFTNNLGLLLPRGQIFS